MTKYPDTWNLDELFEGGVTGDAFKQELKDITEERDHLIEALDAIDLTTIAGQGAYADLLNDLNHFEYRVSNAGIFAQMCSDVDIKNSDAVIALDKVMTIGRPYQLANNRFNKKLSELSDEQWANFLSLDPINQSEFYFNELRRDANRLMGEEAEELLAELNPDGNNGWSNTYNTINSVMTISCDLDDGHHEFSVGQALNRLSGDPKAENRAIIFEAWEEAFTHYGPIFADVLNHLDGYHMTVQKAHKYDHFLEEPLEYNRMQKDTLDAMWQAVSEEKSIFVDYLNRKKELLKLDKLSWQDVEAPLVLDDSETKELTIDESYEFVIEQFGNFGPKLQSFAKHAIESGWIEAENRPGKRAGGYCTSVKGNEESRIFMTFTGSAGDASTIAHELGHAFHSHVMKDLPKANQSYAMNVAETASTLAETIVSDANVKQASSKEERLSLLASKLENATSMFMNIHARYLFEKSFYEMRSEGFVSEAVINDLMTKAQEEAFAGALDEYHPHFWASKLHFFFDDVPFYNFPYTFGYIFSLNIYAHFLDNPEGFEEKYIAILRDTGSMTVEDLVKKHLDEDITKVDFWKKGIAVAKADAETFLEETENLI